MIPAYLSWSSGKDSAFALVEARRAGLVDVVGLFTTVDETDGSVPIHGTDRRMLDAQLAAVGLPSVVVPLPRRCSNAVYEARVGTALGTLRAEGVERIVFGDLFLDDIRAYRERLLASAGLSGDYPLWGRDTTLLAQAVIASGIRATVIAVDTKQLPASFAGRRFDASLLDDLPDGVDPCGERGEFHTFVHDGPMFAHPLALRLKKTRMDGAMAEAVLTMA